MPALDADLQENQVDGQIFWAGVAVRSAGVAGAAAGGLGARLRRAAALGASALAFALVSQAAWPQASPAPSFWDPQHRLEAPDLSGVRVLRFATEDDYPPFDFTAPDGTLTGFNVDLARALCEALNTPCTVQQRRWDTLLDAVEQGASDAAIASIAITPANSARVAFTNPYYKTPGRFAARTGATTGAPTLGEATPESLVGKRVGVERRTAHEAYLRAYFPGVDLRVYDDAAAVRAALKRGEIDLLFSDGVSLAIWLNGTDAAGCCRLVGGPFTQASYFGDGVGIAVAKSNNALRRALNFGLARLSERGVYADLYLKYFPIGFY